MEYLAKLSDKETELFQKIFLRNIMVRKTVKRKQ
jgi:hypothetical protein